jgi:protein TonB
MRSRVVGLALSGVLHAALVLSLLAVVGGTESRMVFVDLFQDQGAGKPRAAEAPAPAVAPPPKPAPARSAPPIPAVAVAVEPPRVEAPTPAPPPMASEPVRPALEPPRPAPEPVRPTLEPPLVPLPRIVETAPPTGLAPTGGESGASAAVAPRLSERSAPGGREGAARSSPGARRPAAGVSLSDVGAGAAGAGSGSEARDGSPLALAVPGSGGDSAASDYAGYYDTLRRRIHESLRYPPDARRRGAAGTVVVDAEIEPTGVVGRVTLAASSSHATLDEAALEAVRGLPRVPFPSGVQPRRLWVRLPVVFELR